MSKRKDDPFNKNFKLKQINNDLELAKRSFSTIINYFLSNLENVLSDSVFAFIGRFWLELNNHPQNTIEYKPLSTNQNPNSLNARQVNTTATSSNTASQPPTSDPVRTSNLNIETVNQSKSTTPSIKVYRNRIWNTESKSTLQIKVEEIFIPAVKNNDLPNLFDIVDNVVRLFKFPLLACIIDSFHNDEKFIADLNAMANQFESFETVPGDQRGKRLNLMLLHQNRIFGLYIPGRKPRQPEKFRNPLWMALGEYYQEEYSFPNTLCQIWKELMDNLKLSNFEAALKNLKDMAFHNKRYIDYCGNEYFLIEALKEKFHDFPKILDILNETSTINNDDIKEVKHFSEQSQELVNLFETVWRPKMLRDIIKHQYQYEFRYADPKCLGYCNYADWTKFKEFHLGYPPKEPLEVISARMFKRAKLTQNLHPALGYSMESDAYFWLARVGFNPIENYKKSLESLIFARYQLENDECYKNQIGLQNRTPSLYYKHSIVILNNLPGLKEAQDVIETSLKALTSNYEVTYLVNGANYTAENKFSAKTPPVHSLQLR